MVKISLLRLHVTGSIFGHIPDCFLYNSVCMLLHARARNPTPRAQSATSPAGSHIQWVEVQQKQPHY